ncbi:MAG: hypothetical protein MUC49_21100 [Raineya sp.]|jgi:hypothetical protein|nr:hypothetical protein [Raineya sp.]
MISFEERFVKMLENVVSSEDFQNDNILDSAEKNRLFSLCLYFYYALFARKSCTISTSGISSSKKLFNILNLPFDAEIGYYKKDFSRNYRKATWFGGDLDTYENRKNDYLYYIDLDQNGLRQFRIDNFISLSIFGIKEDLWNNAIAKKWYTSKENQENEYLEEFRELSDRYLQYASLFKDLEPLFPVVQIMTKLLEDEPIELFWVRVGSQKEETSNQVMDNEMKGLIKAFRSFESNVSETKLLTKPELLFYLHKADFERHYQNGRILFVDSVNPFEEDLSLLDYKRVISKSQNRIIWDKDIQGRMQEYKQSILSNIQRKQLVA